MDFPPTATVLAAASSAASTWPARLRAALADPVNAYQVSQILAAEFSDVANGEFPGEFMNVFSDEVNIFRMSCQAIYPVRWRSVDVALNVDGQITGPCDAQNVQWTATKKGDFADRHSIGSVHVGGMAISTYNAGLLTAGFKATAQTLVDFLASQLTLIDIPVILAPAILNKGPLVPPVEGRLRIIGGTEIKEWVLQPQLRTQRTRNVGKGV